MNKLLRLLLGITLELVAMYMLYSTAIMFELSDNVISWVITIIKGYVVIFTSFMYASIYGLIKG